MARRKELRYLTVELLDGFNGTGAVNDSLAALDTVMGIDTLDLADDRTIVPVGARFTTAGIATVRTVTATQYSMQWTVTIDATGGTFTLTFDGQTTSALAENAAAADVETALEALSNVGVDELLVTGSAGGPFTITAAGTLANTSGFVLSANGASLTGGASTAVVATVQDGTDTWEITFTPAIATGSVPANNDVVTFYPRKLEAKIGEGNIEHTKNKDPQIDLDRGILDGARAGSEQPMEVSFSYVYDWLKASSGDPITVDEALEQEGDASDWISAAADPCEPYQVTIKVIDKPPCGSEEAEVILYKYFMPRTINASVEAASVTVTGVCVATKPTKYRVANNDNAIGVIY